MAWRVGALRKHYKGLAKLKVLHAGVLDHKLTVKEPKTPAHFNIINHQTSFMDTT